MINYRKLFFLLVVALFLLVSSVSALEVTNTTVRAVTDIAYPSALFYAIAMLGTILLLTCIYFIFQQTIPASPLAVAGILGFSFFLVAAYMAPMVADITVVSTEAETSVVSNYLFSPWVSYLCLGMGTICVLFFAYGVLRYFQMLAARKKDLSNPDYQFEMYLQGRDS